MAFLTISVIYSKKYYGKFLNISFKMYERSIQKGLYPFKNHTSNVICQQTTVNKEHLQIEGKAHKSKCKHQAGHRENF